MCAKMYVKIIGLARGVSNTPSDNIPVALQNVLPGATVRFVTNRQKQLLNGISARFRRLL
jgi:hypothetical protein